RGAIDYATDQQRRQFITMFTGANLAEADFQDAELAGADFRESELRGAIFLHANIARASFVRAKNIEPDQMMKACVGQPGMDEQEFEAQQPYFSAVFLKKLGGKRIPRCKAEDDHSPD
ncbi:pentapeptide repeat-containing protein, partial [Tardiphaga sp. P5_C10]